LCSPVVSPPEQSPLRFIEKLPYTICRYLSFSPLLLRAAPYSCIKIINVFFFWKKAPKLLSFATFPPVSILMRWPVNRAPMDYSLKVDHYPTSHSFFTVLYLPSPCSLNAIKTLFSLYDPFENKIPDSSSISSASPIPLDPTRGEEDRMHPPDFGMLSAVPAGPLILC